MAGRHAGTTSWLKNSYSHNTAFGVNRRKRKKKEKEQVNAGIMGREGRGMDKSHGSGLKIRSDKQFKRRKGQKREGGGEGRGSQSALAKGQRDRSAVH